MTPAAFAIEAASPASLDEILSLLSRVGLPHDGVEEHLHRFLVARGSQNQIIGCAALEYHDRTGLLRSVAVLPEFRGQAVAETLVRALLERAARDGLSRVALLTTTAKDYFEIKFGFVKAERAQYQNQLADSAEWKLPRCSSAVFMTLEV